MSKSDNRKLMYPQGKLICTVCNEEFEANDNTRYIIYKGYTCSWECFFNEVIKLDKERIVDDEQQSKRGRKRSKL